MDGNDDMDFGVTVRGLAPGLRVFGRYTLARVLGRGGMGVVWLARDEELGEEIALKFLPEVIAHDESAIAELKTETRRCRQLTHPHIVRVHGFEFDATSVAISMEFVAGGTLGARRVQQPGRCFEVEDIRPWVLQICSALTYAHGDAGVVHRDLKPANLMLDGRGRAKIADFGISTSVTDAVTRVSRVGRTSYTPNYASPQQMAGGKPGVADDIYSLGATIYELLTSRPPFHTGDVHYQVREVVPATMSERRIELGVAGQLIPPEWEDLVGACLSKDPAQRPATAAEVARRIEQSDVTIVSHRKEVVQPAEKAANRDSPRTPQPMRMPAKARNPTVKAAASRLDTEAKPSAARWWAVAAAALAIAFTVWQTFKDAPGPGSPSENVPSASTLAPASDPALAATGELELTSVYFSVLPAAEWTLRIDGRERSFAPDDRNVRVGELAAGPHVVELAHPNFQPWREVIDITADERANVTVHLISIPGVVTFTSTPPGARVSATTPDAAQLAIIAQFWKENATPLERHLPPGEYTARFSLAGYQPQEQTFRVSPGEALVVEAVLVATDVLRQQSLTSEPSTSDADTGAKLANQSATATDVSDRNQAGTNDGTYAIETGDTLSSIAAKVGIPQTALVVANPEVDWRRLRVGQEISVAPLSDSASEARTALPPVGVPRTRADDGTYIIKTGDSMGRIATSFGISIAELMAVNPGVDPRRLRIGQRIVIPEK